MSDARRRQYMRLKAEVLRVHLMQANLVTSGTKQTMVERLLSHESSQQDAARSHSPMDSEAESGSSSGAHQRGSRPSSSQDIHRILRTQQGQPPPPPPPPPEPSAEHSPSPVRGRRHHETAAAPGSSRRHARSRSSRRGSRSPRPKRRHHGRSGSGSSSSASSGSSSSSSSKAWHRHRRHHCCRSSSLEDFWAPPFPSCTSTPAKYMVRRIRRGKFVNFDKLLGPAMAEGTGAFLDQEKREKEKGAGRRRVVDLASWLEAWNVFLAVRIQTAPDSALALVKYQAIMTMLFSSYPPGVCLKYDSTFQQAVARDRSYLTPWDQVKEDILV